MRGDARVYLSREGTAGGGVCGLCASSSNPKKATGTGFQKAGLEGEQTMRRVNKIDFCFRTANRAETY